MCNWKAKFDSISSALKKGKAPVDFSVENALLKSALGYTVTVREPMKVRVEKMKPGIGRVTEERIETVEREIHIPANVTAQIYWLNNRRPERWRNKPMIEKDNATMDKLDAMLAEVKAHASNAKAE